ncbi:MAG: hypothetical protein AAGF53_10305 [Pseudomonadota bacterium]
MLERSLKAEQSKPRKSSKSLTYNLTKLWSALRSLPVRRKHFFWVGLIALIYFRPFILAIVILITFWVSLIAYLTLGHDRFFEIMSSTWMRFSNRFPHKAEKLRLRADRFAERFDRFLDYLPESWAEKLSLPDFSRRTAYDDQPDPFDRLAAEPKEA